MFKRWIICFSVLVATATLVGDEPEPMQQIYHPVSTKNPEVQRLFDRGLAFIFAYNHDIAFQSFKKASELDPELAMAYWGMAMAHAQNVNEDITPQRELECYAYMQKANQLASKATPSEKAYIGALTTRFTNDPNADLITLRTSYKDAMKKVTVFFPEDLDAATLYAESLLEIDPWKWWSPAGEPKPGTMEAIQYLNFVMRRNPLHIGANHFMIHAWEESPWPERALMSANRLQWLFPESGHLLHMPCHIFLPVGDYAAALKTNLNALKQDFAYYKSVGLADGTYPLHYLGHNLFVMMRIYMLLEDYGNAIKVAQEVRRFIEPHLDIVPKMARYANIPSEVNLYFHRWKEAIEVEAPQANAPASTFAFWHFSRAYAFVKLGAPTHAQMEREKMQKFREKITDQEEIANNPAKDVLKLADKVLEAAFAKSKNQMAEAIKAYSEAVQIQDRLYYDEPPAWYQACRLPLGFIYLEQGDFVKAEEAFSQVLKSLQRNGRALFGLYHSLKGQNRHADAEWVKREMAAALRMGQLPTDILNFQPGLKE